MAILTRSDGIPKPDSFGETLNGIEFQINGNDFISISAHVDGEVTALADPVVIQIDDGDVFEFLVLDDGANLSFTIQEVGGEGRRVTVIAVSALEYDKNHVVFHNREATHGSHTAYLDDVTVAAQLSESEPKDIEILDAEFTGAKELTFHYAVTGEVNQFQVGLYYSADQTFDPNDDIRIDGLKTVTAHPTNPQAPATITLDGDRTWSARADMPYILVVVDPLNPDEGVIAEIDEDNNVAGILLPTPGVTVLVHGFNPTGDGIDGEFDQIGDGATDYWRTTEQIRGLMRRYGGGEVYRYNSDNGEFEQFEDPEDEFGFVIWNNPNGQAILFHDWARESDDKESGQAEAAAEALFTALVQAEYAKPNDPETSRPFHFIGHSRGTVVVSETVQRLDVYDIPVNYVTYLDVHDFDEDDVSHDEYFHDPAVQVWENVLYAENLYQETDEWWIPSGRELIQLASDFNTELTGLLDGAWPPILAKSSHGLVTDWYLGTVAPGTVELNDDTEDWYQDGIGAEQGFSKWWSSGGYANDESPGILEKTKSKTLKGLNRFPDEKDGDRDFDTPIFFNGNFELPDLHNTSLAGWSFHGGKGNAKVKTENGNSYLSFYSPGGTRTHNRFYVPENANFISFDLLIDSDLPNHSFSVTLDRPGEPSHLLADIPLTNRTDGFVPIHLPISQQNDGNSIRLLTFRSEFSGVSSGLHESAVGIDNVRLLFDELPHLEITTTNTAIREGSSVTLSGFFNDPGPHTLNIDWGDGNVEQITIADGQTTFDLSHSYRNNRPATDLQTDYVIEVVEILEDENGTRNGIRGIGIPIVVINDPPKIGSITTSYPNNQALAGDLISLTGTFQDLGLSDSHSGFVNWGDGTESDLVVSGINGSGTFEANHRYHSGGSYTVTITLVDNDGGKTTTTINLNISGTHLIDGTLHIMGTNNDDIIIIRPSQLDQIIVYSRSSGRNIQEPFPANINRIVVNLFDGNDRFYTFGLDPIPIDVYGGNGNDFIRGTSGTNVLFGGDGRDLLFGVGGDDILIGGNGMDFLFGGNGRDILIGGNTSLFFDELLKIQLVWLQPNSDLNSVAQLFEKITDDRDDIFGRDFLYGGLGADLYLRVNKRWDRVIGLSDEDVDRTVW